MTEQLIDKWITELQELGFDHDGMIRVFRLAQKKFNHMITDKAKGIKCSFEVITGEIADATNWENQDEPEMICPECKQEVMEHPHTS